MTQFHSAQAGNTSSSIPHTIHAHDNGVIIFGADGTYNGVRPACATLHRWAFSANTPSGQAMLSVLLTAVVAKKNIVVFGAGNCNAWSDTESVSYLYWVRE